MHWLHATHFLGQDERERFTAQLVRMPGHVVCLESYRLCDVGIRFLFMSFSLCGKALMMMGFDRWARGRLPLI